MSIREQRRVQVLNRVLAGAWTRQQAAATLGRSERQLRRLLRAYQARGPAGIVHGNRGRRPAHALPAALRERVLELARTTYAGCNDVHLAELLAEREDLGAGIAVSRATLQRWRRGAEAGGLSGVGSPRSRRRPTHRTRRERAAREGQLVQADGSPHRWLGPGGPEWTLIAGIDDATGTVPWALFRAQEDAAGYMLWLRRVVETRGVPVAVYVDRHGIFQRRKHEALTLEEELAGGPLPTQVGRVLGELGIRSIHALSPQAKGRVERLFGTLQDRLVAELRLAGVHATSSMDAANRALWAYLPRFNARFAVPPGETASAYRRLTEVVPRGVSLDQICCFKYERVVGMDNTVRFGDRRLQLGPGPRGARRSFAKARVEVHERLDGSLAVFHDGHVLATTPAPAEAPVLRARRLPRPPRPPGSPSATAPTPAPAEPSPLGAAPAGPQRRAGDPQPPTHPWKRTRVVDLPVRRYPSSAT
jgi:winged helix-turn helix protein